MPWRALLRVVCAGVVEHPPDALNSCNSCQQRTTYSATRAFVYLKQINSSRLTSGRYVCPSCILCVCWPSTVNPETNACDCIIEELIRWHASLGFHTLYERVFCVRQLQPTVAPVSNGSQNKVHHMVNRSQSDSSHWTPPQNQTSRQRSHRPTVHNTSRVPASIHNLRLELRHPQLTLHPHQWTQLHLPRAACSHPNTIR